MFSGISEFEVSSVTATSKFSGCSFLHPIRLIRSEERRVGKEC